MRRNGNQIDWTSKISKFGATILADLGESPFYLPTRYNPITRALKSNPEFFARYEDDRRFTKIGLAKLATICQMVVYDASGGPEGDQQPKALRRHWYQWFKIDFAQPFSEFLGEDTNDEKWGLLWAGLLSKTYARLVDDYDVTYLDLWIEDGSRMIERFHESLFLNSNIVIAVEKDSLFPDFRDAAQSLGAKVLISGKGKNSKAAIEKMLREHFNWPYRQIWNSDTQDYDYLPAFTADRPLIVLHISDYDYDGEEVIGWTFGNQARRYTPHILEARVGIDPHHVATKGYTTTEKWYQVKVKRNKNYVTWTEEKALFLGTCLNCGEQTILRGIHDNTCPECGSYDDFQEIDIFAKGDGGKYINPAFGFEVEAMRTADYRSLLVDALLQVLPFEFIVERLRHEITADDWEAVQSLVRHITGENAGIADILAEIRRLEELTNAFEQEIQEAFSPYAQEHRGDFWEDGDDPEVSDFVRHVERGGYGPWRPFDRWHRTELLEQQMQDELANEIQGLVDQEVTRDAQFDHEGVTVRVYLNEDGQLVVDTEAGYLSTGDQEDNQIVIDIIS